MTRGGELFELPTPERRISEPGSSSLPTPVADHSRGLAQPGSDFQSLPNVALSLLPTPTVMDMGANYTPEEWQAWKAKQQAAHQNGNGHGASLTQESISLMPTPTSQEPGYIGPLVDEEGRPVEHLAQRCYDPVTGRLVQTGLVQFAQLIGASTPPRLTAGSESSDGPHPAPPSPEPTDDPDLLPLSSSG